MFLDLAMAFDTVDQSTLFEKSQTYCSMGPVHLLLKYNFSDKKKQFIWNQNVQSNVKTVETCVLLASLFGPIIFLHYINDHQ